MKYLFLIKSAHIIVFSTLKYKSIYRRFQRNNRVKKTKREFPHCHHQHKRNRKDRRVWNAPNKQGLNVGLLHVETARGVKLNTPLHIKKIIEGLQVNRKELKVKSI